MTRQVRLACLDVATLAVYAIRSHDSVVIQARWLSTLNDSMRRVRAVSE